MSSTEAKSAQVVSYSIVVKNHVGKIITNHGLQITAADPVAIQEGINERYSVSEG